MYRAFANCLNMGLIGTAMVMHAAVKRQGMLFKSLGNICLHSVFNTASVFSCRPLLFFLFRQDDKINVLDSCFFTVWHLRKVPLTFSSLSVLLSLTLVFSSPEKKKTLFEKLKDLQSLYFLLSFPPVFPLINTRAGS